MQVLSFLCEHIGNDAGRRLSLTSFLERNRVCIVIDQLTLLRTDLLLDDAFGLFKR